MLLLINQQEDIPLLFHSVLEKVAVLEAERWKVIIVDYYERSPTVRVNNYSKDFYWHFNKVKEALVLHNGLLDIRWSRMIWANGKKKILDVKVILVHSVMRSNKHFTVNAVKATLSVEQENDKVDEVITTALNLEIDLFV